MAVDDQLDGNLISGGESQPDFVTLNTARSQTAAMLVENSSDVPDVPQPISFLLLLKCVLWTRKHFYELT